MQFKKLVTLALASNAVAQAPPTLQQALASQASSLSLLSELLGTVPPAFVSSLAQAQNVTILAPNNNAIQKLLSDTATAAALTANPSLLTAILSYHVLNGTYYASDFTGTSFPRTYLTNQTYTNVTSGQRVQVTNQNGNVTVYSALKEKSTVVTANLNFTGGVIHIIDTLLSVPQNISTTLIASNLTALAGAATQASLVGPLSSLRDVTIFAPNNAAFGAIGSATAGLSTQQLAGILGYHVINGTVGYSTTLTNTTLKTLGGQTLTITVNNGSVFVNSAKVVLADVLVANGVVHVIDNVLNPDNTSAAPNPAASAGTPAFSGASSATGIPFTSGVPTPSSTAPAATSAGGSATSSTKSALAAPMQTGAVGAAALFGGAVILANL